MALTLTINEGFKEDVFFSGRYERFLTRAYWNEERERRLEVVKLLTALSYCVDGSFIWSAFQH